MLNVDVRTWKHAAAWFVCWNDQSTMMTVVCHVRLWQHGDCLQGWSLFLLDLDLVKALRV